MTERPHEEEQRDIFDDGDQHGRRDVVDAVGERHQENDHHQQQIDDDQVPIGVRVVIGKDARIDHRKHSDQERHRVDDRQPPPDGPRIAFGAEFGESGQRAQPCKHRRGAARGDRFVFAHRRAVITAGSYKSLRQRASNDRPSSAAGQKLSSNPPVPSPSSRSKSLRFCSWIMAFCCSRASASALRHST
jgi:hypothetical protein